MTDNFLAEEIRDGYLITTQMKQHWAISLDLLEKFMEVCERNNLKYFAVYGTLLGAVRHGGFIPWDDDIDMAMPREDYEKLCKIAEAEFKFPYFLQTPENDTGYFSGSAALRNGSTTHTWPHELQRRFNKGCRIDILVFDGAGSGHYSYRQQRQIEKLKEMLLTLSLYDDLYLTSVPQKHRMIFLEAKKIGHECLCAKYKAACSRFTDNHSRHLRITSGSKRSQMPRELYESTVKFPFEHLQIPVPSGYMQFIKQVYKNGDMPDEIKRVPKHGGIIDTKKSYKEYDCVFTEVFENPDNLPLYLFGAGNMLRVYMERYGNIFPPVAVFDNDPKKWGKTLYGVLVLNPAELPGLYKKGIKLVMTNYRHNDIGAQFKSMGIEKYNIYLEERKYTEYANKSNITNNSSKHSTVTEKKYKNGFVAGVFDMFHMGHLNLIVRAKDICEHLVVGIVTDDIPIEHKGKRPYIPLDERIAIVKAIEYVDEVAVLPPPYHDKRRSWERFQYDAFISGDDWATNENWLKDQAWLRSVGSDLVFLSYTKERTSTRLREAVGFDDKVIDESRMKQD